MDSIYWLDSLLTMHKMKGSRLSGKYMHINIWGPSHICYKLSVGYTCPLSTHSFHSWLFDLVTKTLSHWDCLTVKSVRESRSRWTSLKLAFPFSICLGTIYIRCHSFTVLRKVRTDCGCKCCSWSTTRQQGPCRHPSETTDCLASAYGVGLLATVSCTGTAWAGIAGSSWACSHRLELAGSFVGSFTGTRGSSRTRQSIL